MDGATDPWFDRELAGCTLADERLSKRLRKLLVQIGSAMEQSIPLVCQDWANTKAAYRFFSNERVSEADILAGHFQSTHDRVAAAEGPVLVLHDTTEFTYQREKPEAIGITKSINSGRDKAGRLRSHTVCGILMHSSLVVTMEGLPLGLSAVKFWTRKKFKGTAALKKKVNPTRIPIEKKESIRWLENLKQSTELLDDPGRCVHVGDRESDIYELFCAAQEVGTHFLVRTCVDRLAGDGDHTIADEMADVAVKGLRRVGDSAEDTVDNAGVARLRHTGKDFSGCNVHFLAVAVHPAHDLQRSLRPHAVVEPAVEEVVQKGRAAARRAQHEQDLSVCGLGHGGSYP